MDNTIKTGEGQESTDNYQLSIICQGCKCNKNIKSNLTTITNFRDNLAYRPKVSANGTNRPSERFDDEPRIMKIFLIVL